MRRTLALLAGASVGLVALLAGCTPQPLQLPPGPSESEVAEYNRVFLDRTWDALSVSNTVERPTVEPGEPLTEAEWSMAVFECLANGEHTNVGMGWETGGPAFINSGPIDGSDLDEAFQLNFYACAAAHPFDLSDGTVLSEEQQEYFSEYYDRWLIPCLYVQGYSVAGEVIEIRDTEAGWSPYWGLTDRNGVWAEEAAYLRSVEVCGPSRPGMN